MQQKTSPASRIIIQGRQSNSMQITYKNVSFDCQVARKKKKGKKNYSETTAIKLYSLWFFLCLPSGHRCSYEAQKPQHDVGLYLVLIQPSNVKSQILFSKCLSFFVNILLKLCLKRKSHRALIQLVTDEVLTGPKFMSFFG